MQVILTLFIVCDFSSTRAFSFSTSSVFVFRLNSCLLVCDLRDCNSVSIERDWAFNLEVSLLNNAITAHCQNPQVSVSQNEVEGQRRWSQQTMQPFSLQLGQFLVEWIDLGGERGLLLDQASVLLRILSSWRLRHLLDTLLPSLCLLHKGLLLSLQGEVLKVS